MPSPQPSPAQLADLGVQAQRAATHAYCPASGFTVGTALLVADGTVFTGCNVENASYGLTVCAERNAVGAMVVAGHLEIVAVAVFTPTDQPSVPCGACRQVLAEFAEGCTPVVLGCRVGEPRVTTLGALFPEPFAL